MFEAELAGKLPEIKGHEDYLTSCIFGSLKYIKPELGLLPIIYDSICYENGRFLREYLKIRGCSKVT